MSESEANFEVLVARARAGNSEAVAELVRLYEPEVRIVARVLLGAALRPHLDSLDLVQSVHKSVMLGLRTDRFDISTPENLIALALTMVRRKVAHKWRHARRQQRLSHGPGKHEGLADLLGALVSTEADPARAAQLNDAVHQLCAGLNERDRLVIEMRLQGYSAVETAKELGENADALRAHLSRLRHRLREAGVLSEWL